MIVNPTQIDKYISDIKSEYESIIEELKEQINGIKLERDLALNFSSKVLEYSSEELNIFSKKLYKAIKKLKIQDQNIFLLELLKRENKE